MGKALQTPAVGDVRTALGSVETRAVGLRPGSGRSLARLAAFERDLIRERTVAGLEDARSRGARLERPTVINPAKLAAARALIEGDSTVTDAAEAGRASRPTLYRHLSR